MVTRRKSLHTAKDEMLEASWEKREVEIRGWRIERQREGEQRVDEREKGEGLTERERKKEAAEDRRKIQIR